MLGGKPGFEDAIECGAIGSSRFDVQAGIRGDDGIRLNLRFWGEGEPRYFLIHGFGEGSFSWESIASSLSLAGAVVAIDLRGHGDSDRDPEGTYEPERHVRDVGAALHAWSMRDLVLVGHSMGAAIAIHVATRWQDRIRGLVLIDGGPYLRRAALTHVREEFIRQPRFYQSVEQFTARLIGKLPLARSSVLQELAPNALRRTAQGNWELKCDPALSNAPIHTDDAALCRQLSRVSCPVLLVRGGASSVLSKAAAERALAAIRDGRLRCVGGAGHAVMFDNPEGLLAAVGPFVDELRLETVAAPGRARL